ncbi:unnamed protein product [Litomosoides sigmodontis]|uniref:Uncharacterized protein n=1 Tax=Litomosoides sigmodontis TaxID=42156 RepID=A0A3P6V3S8_LITSI|nr:unnamed protein product [Litomosoides sigmodontis]
MDGSRRVLIMGQIEGGWRDWSAWSMCSVTCGRGLRRRWRLCDSPVPRNGGHLCVGNFVEFSNCNVGNCTKSPSSVITTACSCGCLLSHDAGRFFARTCKEITDWTLKSRGRFLRLKLEHASTSMTTADQFTLAIYQDLEKQELIHRSGIDSSHVVKDNLQFISENYFIISLLKVNGPPNINSGVEINFEWRNASDELTLSPVTALNSSHVCRFCHRNSSFFLSTLFIILIISLPPFICSYATVSVVRKAKWKRSRQLRVDSLLEESRPDLSIIQSRKTDTTEITSNRIVITKRSIGIQLSATSTPRLLRDKGILWSRVTDSPQMTLGNDEHSSLSFNTDHDFEYDYYEPAIPGSFLTSAINFCSDIDVEKIIGGSEISCRPIATHDVHTQIEDCM